MKSLKKEHKKSYLNVKLAAIFVKKKLKINMPKIKKIL